MDARPLLERVVRALEKHHLEVVLIGNAGAALQGAPVTTLDFDFMFRKTATNLRKLKSVTTELERRIAVTESRQDEKRKGQADGQGIPDVSKLGEPALGLDLKALGEDPPARVEHAGDQVHGRPHEDHEGDAAE